MGLWRFKYKRKNKKVMEIWVMAVTGWREMYKLLLYLKEIYFYFWICHSNNILNIYWNINIINQRNILFFKRWIPGHLTCLMRNLYSGQEATVRPEHGTTDWIQIGKGVCQWCILSPCLFNLYAEYIKWNARLDNSQLEYCQEKYQQPQICWWHHPYDRK